MKMKTRHNGQIHEVSLRGPRSWMTLGCTKFLTVKTREQQWPWLEQSVYGDRIIELAASKEFL